MSRKRLTQVFPFLLPLRKWQRKKLFYLEMLLDGNRYTKKKSETLLPNTVFKTSSLMLNENSGFDMQYQINKVHNLKLAAKTINKVIIAPNDTFSFWQLVRRADRHEKYKDGLELVNGSIVGSYGGGLCQLSNMLFWLFLHTPMRIVERHGHGIESFPSTTEDLPCGTDATIYEGWLDLKVRNDTDNTFQIEISFDDSFMYGRILSQTPVSIDYKVFNSTVFYVKREEKNYQIATVCRSETDRVTGAQTEKELYINKCEIAYALPADANIEE
ncbi:MAG: glycopeptide resistance accessory protein VanW [Lachnospiraceae bacterium]|nr:glycopeptide resistance accessory protein VanW [Lachnospiraceae bacterium]